MRSSSPAPIWLRFTAIGVGVIVLFWLPTEDTNLIVINIIGIIITILITTRALIPFASQRRRHVFWYALIGGLAGIVIAPIILLLMVFKAGIHSHNFPEYSANQILSVLKRTPIYLGAGLLIGFGGGLWRNAQ